MDTLELIGDMSARGQIPSVGNVPIYGGVEGGMTAAHALQQGVHTGIRMTALAAGLAMLPFGAIAWGAGLSAFGAMAGNLGTGLYIGASIVGAGVDAWWGYESTVLRNPNATNGEKLFATILGGVTGWMMPGMAIGQAFGGGYGLIRGVNGNLPPEYVLSEMGKWEVIGGIAGGAFQALAMGGLLGGLDDGILAGLNSVILDAGAAYLGYEMANAVGMDPWEGANIGMTLSGFARMAIGGVKSLASRRNGMTITEEARIRASPGGGRQRAHSAGVNRQFNFCSTARLRRTMIRKWLTL